MEQAFKNNQLLMYNDDYELEEVDVNKVIKENKRR
jgi:hypothetical protein